MKKALIIGASGLVGGYLYKSLKPDFQTARTHFKYPFKDSLFLDITDEKSIQEIIDDFNPELVLLPAALTSVDYCEENEKRCTEINVNGVANLVSAIGNKKIKLVYLSTDYIFNGKDGPYDEYSQPDPLNTYGKSKLEGEKIILNTLNNFLIIRTTCVYGHESQGKNFVLNLIKKIKNKLAVFVPKDQITTPTYAGALAEAILNLVKVDKIGIYNVAGGSLMSRFDFALLAADTFELDKKFIRPVLTKELPQKAKRPLLGGLRTDKLARELGIQLPQAREGLLLMKEEVFSGSQ